MSIETNPLCSFTTPSFAKEKIALAPNNAAAWNYIRGVLDRSQTPYSALKNFVTPYTIPDELRRPENPADEIDLDDPKPTEGVELPCPAAIEFLADIYEEEGGEGVEKAHQLWKSLADEHDTVRKRHVVEFYFSIHCHFD